MIIVLLLFTLSYTIYVFLFDSIFVVIDKTAELHRQYLLLTSDQAEFLVFSIIPDFI